MGNTGKVTFFFEISISNFAYLCKCPMGDGLLFLIGIRGSFVLFYYCYRIARYIFDFVWICLCLFFFFRLNKPLLKIKKRGKKFH